MLGLRLRDEFTGRRLGGTTIDFNNRQKTGALDRTASEFLKITYPSIDLLKAVEAVQEGQAQPVVVIGARGQGKSHLMAAISHMHTDSEASSQWLSEWSSTLGRPEIAQLKIATSMHVIAESVHHHRHKNLWDLLFENHSEGVYTKGKWEGQGNNQTDVPGYDLILEMAEKQPFILILDEFQTWFEGLRDSSRGKHRTWAFNFIQILSEISEKHPDLLTLVVSVRDGGSDATQQLFRVNPVRIDFKGPEAKRDRQRLLLYRIFENRMQVAPADIESLTKTHVDEAVRLSQVSGADQEKYRQEFLESWPYSPSLLRLLDDQVLIAAQTQETRDLLRILVDVFKAAGTSSPVLTPADFMLTNTKAGVVSLLDSVANQLHRELRENALRNLEAVTAGVPAAQAPNLEPILSALWLRSMSLESHAGADPNELQIDITRAKPVDDNRFAAELSIIEDNSFNIHRQSNRLVFKNEVNPQAKLFAHAKNDRLFQNNEDIEYLAKEIRYALVGEGSQSNLYRTIVLKKNWLSDPWSDQSESDQPNNWDNRIPTIVIPKSSVSQPELGKWLKDHVTKSRNTIRFLLPKAGTEDVFFDRSLLILSRLATEWKNSEREYAPLLAKYQKELRQQLQSRFDRFAVLSIWNFADPELCQFEVIHHQADGLKILEKMDQKVRDEIFIPEDFDNILLAAAKDSRSVADVMSQLKEPAGKGEMSLPWIGETAVKERVEQACASGLVDINAAGSLYQKQPAETTEQAWQHIRGKLGSGRTLEETTLHLPGTSVSSGGAVPPQPAPGVRKEPINQPTPQPGPVPPLFPKEHLNIERTSPISLLGKLEQLGINRDSTVRSIRLTTDQLTGLQLQEIIKSLPDGATYSLDLDKD